MRPSELASSVIKAVGLQTAHARLTVDGLQALLAERPSARVGFEVWRDHTSQFLDLKLADELLGKVIRVPDSDTGTRYFIAQSYCRLIAWSLSTSAASQTLARPPAR